LPLRFRIVVAALALICLCALAVRSTGTVTRDSRASVVSHASGIAGCAEDDVCVFAKAHLSGTYAIFADCGSHAVSDLLGSDGLSWVNNSAHRVVVNGVSGPLLTADPGTSSETVDSPITSIDIRC
jgi:hypothetical protein